MRTPGGGSTSGASIVRQVERDRLLAADLHEAAVLEELARLRVALAHLALERVLAEAARALANLFEQRAADPAAGGGPARRRCAPTASVDPGLDEAAADGLVAEARDEVRELAASRSRLKRRFSSVGTSSGVARRRTSISASSSASVVAGCDRQPVHAPSLGCGSMRVHVRLFAGPARARGLVASASVDGVARVDDVWPALGLGDEPRGAPLRREQVVRRARATSSRTGTRWR